MKNLLSEFDQMLLVVTKFFVARMFVIALLLVVSHHTFAQQVPYVNHYFYDSYLINPADAGQDENIKGSVLIRQQWAGIPGAPETQMLFLHGKIPNKKFGLGINITNDVTDILNRFSAMASGSYTVQLAAEHELSFGMSAGMLRYQIDFEKINGDVTDEALLRNASNNTRLEGTAGLSYRYNRIRLGFVTEQLFNRSFTFTHEPDNKNLTFALVRHYNVNMGYEIPVNANFSIRPLVMLRSAQGLASQVDANATFKYRELAWLNLQHRIRSSSAVSLGAAITRQLSFGYSYELPATAIRSVAPASHEFMLAFKFAPAKRGQSTTSGADNPKRKLSESQLSTFEQMDELRQQNEALQEKLLAQRQMLEKQSNELEVLRKNMKAVEIEMREMMRVDSVDLATETEFDKTADYLVVVGAAKRLADARNLQKILQKELGVSTQVRQNDLQSWYFIFTHTVKTNAEAIEEIKALKKIGIERFIVGNPWVYKSQKLR